MPSVPAKKPDFVQETFLLRDTKGLCLALSCRWKISAHKSTASYFLTADVVLQEVPITEWFEQDAAGGLIADITGTPLEPLIRQTCYPNGTSIPATEARTATIILSPRSGYLCRSDIISVRMRHSDFVESIIPFHNWNQKISALASGDRKRPSSLSALLPSSPGALVVKRYSKQTNNSSLALLQHDLERRLNFNWIVSRKPTPRTVAVVGGRPMYDEIQGMYGSRGFFEAAHALGMSLIVFDEPDHWLKKEKHSHLRREFIPMDMSNIAELPRRMADALRDKHVDGIVTFTDSFVIATAEAAEILGLPTEPLSSMQKAHYKHEMRRLVNKTNNIQAMHLTSVDQLEDVELQQSFQSLKYPLIVKPSRGQFSRGVKKVGGDAAMRQAVRELDKGGLMEQGVLIETYVDGPELDANFVLWDGQILFLEVTDNLPCPGDKSAATSDESFVETVQISNSGLPANELSIIRNSLHDSLLQLGFRSGVFHVEARMQNSCMQYQDLRGDNILDLAPVSRSREQDPGVFLIEINARSPGTAGTWASLYTYGVDMGALQLLHAVGDAERFASLSQPFSSIIGRDHVNVGGGGGAQYWGAHCMIPVHRDHVFVPPGFVDMVLAQIPHISSHVSRAELYAEAGTFVSPCDSAWVAYFLLFSKVDRRHLLEMYHLVAQVSRRILDEQMEDHQAMMLSV
ncbi:uncharacterized protein FPRO_02442 [Fusarium proliferatum ET1]|uniref:ATP-grasp domain-containing protein n=1 Tax=Fusarium proliferatum (strain ET1) TaxID=1227346 RepID=A0A1L7V937_FUSPR|nr:uncharacterized protein FPRO_02442 [Fusarium proliferatum ET1]CZR37298.1 uncharacterized protein FPRO_02442 [Fusarium proliferatum ET1]